MSEPGAAVESTITSGECVTFYVYTNMNDLEENPNEEGLSSVNTTTSTNEGMTQNELSECDEFEGYEENEIVNNWDGVEFGDPTSIADFTTDPQTQADAPIIKIVSQSGQKWPASEKLVKIDRRLPKIQVFDVKPPPPGKRCWLCGSCHALNSILKMGDGLWNCVICHTPRDFKNDVALEGEPDVPHTHPTFDEPMIVEGWVCVCTAFNEWTRNNCSVCLHNKPAHANVGWGNKPPHNQIVGTVNYVPLAPIIPRNEPPYDEMAAKRRRRRRRAIKIRKARFGAFGQVVSSAVFPKTESHVTKVVDLFGPAKLQPQFHPSSARHWTKEGMLFKNITLNQMSANHIGMKSVDDHEMLKCEIPTRHMAINSVGWMVTVHKKRMCVWRPVQENFVLHTTVIIPFDVSKTSNLGRVLFEDKSIYIWQRDPSKIHIYQMIVEKRKRTTKKDPLGFDPMANCRLNFQHTTVSDQYLTKSNAVDMAVLDGEYLLFLFNRWIGIYKINPILSWFKGVSFCGTSPRKSGFIKGANGYVYINTTNSIIGIHCAHNTFDFVQVMNNVETNANSVGESMCYSDIYGIFYCSKTLNHIRQSPSLEHTSVRMIDGNQVTNRDNYDTVTKIGGEILNDNSQIDWISNHPQKIYFDTKSQWNSNFERLLQRLFIQWDSSFGISGRMIIYNKYETHHNETYTYGFESVVSQADFDFLRQVVRRDQYNGDLQLYVERGVKPFHTIIGIYEFLYGDELIENIVDQMLVEM